MKVIEVEVKTRVVIGTNDHFQRTKLWPAALVPVAASVISTVGIRLAQNKATTEKLASQWVPCG